MSLGELAAGLEGRVAIVTGAAQGIGESIAKFLARARASVFLADLQRKDGTPGLGLPVLLVGRGDG